MAETLLISVDEKPIGIPRFFFRHTIVWSYLVGAEGISHLWFGGSWVVDLMIVFGMCAIFARWVSRDNLSVKMTRAEVRLWVAAGMPKDIKEWRANRALKEVA